jgi:acyl-CoA reductase-like NAD-dependent aldehyde dehydrogenase
MKYYPMHIGGKPASGPAGEAFASYEPATRRHLADIARAGSAEVTDAVTAARAAFDQGPWPRLTGAERAVVLRRIAARLAQETACLADLEARDGGSTIRKARLSDVPAAVAAFEWSATWAEQLSGTLPALPKPDGEYLSWMPFGVVAAVIPWNLPLTLAAWRVAPAIAAGNTCVVKPASFTSVTALELARITAECGLPAGVLNVICGPGSSVGEELVTHPLVDMAAFTGSDTVGAQVLLRAAGVGKKVRLDLGGKSAAVVLQDADIELAASGIAWGIFFHNGQICMAGSRAVVHRSRYADFVSLVAERAGRLGLGDPLQEATDLGPMVSRQQVRIVTQRVQAALDSGESRLVCGGSRPEPDELPGGLDYLAYYRPTVLADVDNRSQVAREEIFGPVLAVIPAESDEQAIAMANDSSYSLAAAVWSADPERARVAAERLRADRVWVNDYRMVELARPGDDSGAAADGDARWLANELNHYRARRLIRLDGQAGRADRPHYDLLSPAI